MMEAVQEVEQEQGEEQEFNDEAAREASPKRRKPPKGKTVADEVFVDADKQEAIRQQNRLLGLLIGPKNVEKLRAFGYDIVKVSEGPLTPSIAHRGMTE